MEQTISGMGPAHPELALPETGTDISKDRSRGGLGSNFRHGELPTLTVSLSLRDVGLFNHFYEQGMVAGDKTSYR